MYMCVEPFTLISTERSPVLGIPDISIVIET
jgi:hypothetical protein